MTNYNFDRAYDAICEAAGRANTASAEIRAMLEASNATIVLGTLATAIHERARTKEIRNARMSVLRTLTARACKALEMPKLTYKLNKQLDVYECVEAVPAEPKTAADPVLEALAIVLDNLDRDDILNALRNALTA